MSHSDGFQKPDPPFRRILPTIHQNAKMDSSECTVQPLQNPSLVRLVSRAFDSDERHLAFIRLGTIASKLESPELLPQNSLNSGDS